MKTRFTPIGECPLCGNLVAIVENEIRCFPCRFRAELVSIQDPFMLWTIE